LAERLAALEAGTPVAEVAEQLARLYGQKDAAIEAVLGRLAPLEARLAELDPGAAVAGLAARLEAVAWAQGELGAGLAALKAAGEGPLAEIAAQLARLHAGQEAAAEAALARLAALEARLAALEAGDEDRRAAAAAAAAAGATQAGTRAIVTGLAGRATAPRADRPTDGDVAGSAAPAGGAAPDALEAIWTLPRVVSLHRG
jgi:hypothetical protein